MSEKAKMPALKIRYRGDYDFHKLYRDIKSWFDARDYEFFETRYKHKNQKLGSELEINFTGSRDINDYARNVIKVYFHIWDAKEVEVVKNNKKQKLWNGRMMIELTGELELDYEDEWEHSKFTQFLRDLYHKFIIKHEIEDVWADKLFYKMANLQSEIKKSIGMPTGSDVYEDMW